MIFIGIALLVASGLALIVSTDAGSLVGLTQMQTAQVIPLVLILVIFAGGAVFAAAASRGGIAGQRGAVGRHFCRGGRDLCLSG